MSSNSSATGLCFLIILYLTFFHGHTNSSYEEKSFYFAYCGDFKHNIYSCPKNEQIFVNRESFMISTEKQDVIPKDVSFYNTENESDFQECTVFDVDNWRCKKHVSGSYTVTNGNVYEKFSDGTRQLSLDENEKESPIPRYSQISYLEYTIRHTGEYF